MSEKIDMKTMMHEIICFLLRMSGIPWVIREIYARKKVTIVNYHDPDPALFAKHINYFRKHYSIIHIDQLAAAIANEKLHDLPPKSLIITLDDGYAGNERLFETLVKYEIPTLIYVVAGLVDTKRRFWFNAVPKGTKDIHIPLLKSVEDKSRRQNLEKDWGHSDLREYEERDALTCEELKRFINNGGALGSHSMFHPILTKCTEDVGRYEVSQSKQLLEEICGVSVRHFAYPNGDWNAQQRRLIQDAGYITARTIDPGWIGLSPDPFALPSFEINDNAGLNKAIVQASGFWKMIKQLVTRTYRKNMAG